MKNKIVSLLLFLLAAVNMHAADGITVKFDVRNAVLNNVVLVYHMSVNEFALTDGKATVQLDGMDALYANVYYGEKFKVVYLQKGDEMNISFDANDFDNTFAVKGGNEKAVDYLNKIQLTGLPNEAYTQPWGEFKSTVDKKMASMKRLLKARKFAADDKFLKMEEGRITYFYANMMLMYPVSHTYLTQDTTMVLGKEYYDTLRQYVKEDDDLADIDEYRNFMIEAAHIFDEAGKNIRQYYPKVVAEMSYIGENIQSEKVRESLIHFLAFTYVEGNGVENITDLQNLYYTYVTSPRLNAIFKQACAKWDKAAVGRPSPMFKGVDDAARFPWQVCIYRYVGHLVRSMPEGVATPQEVGGEVQGQKHRVRGLVDRSGQGEVDSPCKERCPERHPALHRQGHQVPERLPHQRHSSLHPPRSKRQNRESGYDTPIQRGYREAIEQPAGTVI